MSPSTRGRLSPSRLVKCGDSLPTESKTWCFFQCLVKSPLGFS